MKPKKAKPVLSQIEKTVQNKERLITKLHAQIAQVNLDAQKEVIRIKFRIQLAQTLLDALKKSL